MQLCKQSEYNKHTKNKENNSSYYVQTYACNLSKEIFLLADLLGINKVHALNLSKEIFLLADLLGINKVHALNLSKG